MKRFNDLYLLFFFFAALEDQSRLSRELEDKRRQAEEAQLRLQQERDEAEKEHERMMERINYEQGEKDKIVCSTKDKKSKVFSRRIFTVIMAIK